MQECNLLRGRDVRSAKQKMFSGMRGVVGCECREKLWLYVVKDRKVVGENGLFMNKFSANLVCVSRKEIH